MKSKETKIILSIIATIVIIFSGCNSQIALEANEAKKQLIDKMVEQEHYSISGKTALSFDKAQGLEDLVEFNGYINQKSNLYLDVKIASFEGMPEEKLEIAKVAEKLMIKYANENDWQEISELELAMFTEFTKWNPSFILSQIEQLDEQTENINNKDKLSGIRVRLNEAGIKAQIEEQLRSTLESGLSDEEINEMKDSLGLSEEEFAEFLQSIEVQTADTKKMIDEMVETMQVETYYDIYYDQASLLIREITQNTKTIYKIEGESIEENTLVTINIFDYGKEKAIPVS